MSQSQLLLQDFHNQYSSMGEDQQEVNKHGIFVVVFLVVHVPWNFDAEDHRHKHSELDRH